MSGGGVLLTIAFAQLVPSPTAHWLLWALWWIVVVASGILVGRALWSVLAGIVELIAGPLRKAIDALPFEFHAPISRKPPRVLKEPAALGYLDFEKAAMYFMGKLSGTLGRINKDVERIGKVMTVYTPRIQRLENADINTKIRVTRTVARKLTRHARGLERREVLLRAQVEAMSENYLLRLEAFPPGTDLSALRMQFTAFRDATAGGLDGTRSYKGALITLRGMSVQQDLNEVLDGLVASATKIEADIEAARKFAIRAVGTVQRKQQPSVPAKGGTRRRPR